MNTNLGMKLIATFILITNFFAVIGIIWQMSNDSVKGMDAIILVYVLATTYLALKAWGLANEVLEQAKKHQEKATSKS